MKIAIWGTGTYYKKYISYICEDAIEYIVDTDIKKQGTYIGDRLIQAPESLDADSCDYILILVKETEEIYRYLVEKGVGENKIVDYHSIGKLFEVEPMVRVDGNMMKLKEWFGLTSKKKILFLSHSLGRSGAPIVLMYMASLLRDKYQVLFAGEGQGDLQKELERENISYLADAGIFFEQLKDSDLFGEIDLFFVNTITMSDWVQMVLDKGFPVVWWIHESSPMFYEKSKRIHGDVSKVSCYAVSEKAKQTMSEYYPDMSIGSLSYYIPDTGGELSCAGLGRGAGFRFALLGVIDQYKAQDLVLEAIKIMDKSVAEQIEVVIAGKIISKEKEQWESAFGQCPQVKYVGELSQEEVGGLYKKIDVLLCTSRIHDTMPVVVTQAMMNGIPCIVSDMVGHSKFIENKKNGFVFSSENVNELAAVMEWCVKNRYKMAEFGMESRNIYENNFSHAYARKNIGIIVEKHILE